MSSALDVFKLPLSGKFLIEAGAGTGKTYSITSLYLRVLIEKQLMPNQILVLTFTNDATNELKQRLRARIQEVLNVYYGENSNDDFLVKCASSLTEQQATHLQQCLYAFDEAAVSTIHGFCQRLLSENAIDFEVSPTFELLTDELSLLTESTDAFWIQFFFETPANTVFEKWYKAFFEEIFKSPEDFIKKYRDILLNSDLDISAYKRPFETFIDLYDKAYVALQRLKLSVDEHQDELHDLFDNGPLSGRYYRNKEKMLAEFEALVRASNQPGLVYNNAEDDADKVESRFIKFGNFMPNKGLLKNKTINHLSLFDRVDKFYLANQELIKIKEAFLFEAISDIRCRFAEMKRRRNQVGYNDLLLLVRNTFKLKPHQALNTKERYPVAFIDEFQDTDHIQFSIFQKIYDRSKAVFWVMIGDPKQAIYRFRGADINTYLYAKTEVHKEDQRSLLHNYRSSKSLIKGINSFFNQAENPFLLEGLKFENAIYPEHKPTPSVITNGEKPIAPVTVVKFVQDGLNVGDLKSKVMDSVGSEIISLLSSEFKIDNRPLSTADIAILVDKHKHAKELQDRLSKRGLNSIIRSRTSVFESQVADDLYRIFRAIAEFENERYIRAALLTHSLHYSSEEILQVFETDERVTEITQQFSSLNGVWQGDGFSKFFNRLLTDFEVEENLAQSEQPERALTNLYHIKELLVRAVREHGLGMQGLLRYFQEKKENPNTDNEAEIIRLESDGDLIQIVTHHSCKGLEYPVVFCPFLWDMKKSNPDYVVQSNGMSTKVVFKDDTDKFELAKEDYKRDELSEQMRLAYVALTRARLKCFIYTPAIKKVKDASGNNVIGDLWENNVVPQLEKLFEIEVKELVTDLKIFTPKRENAQLNARITTFKRRDIWEYPRVVSYSSIASKKHSNVDEIDYKDIESGEKAISDEEINEKADSVFTLPKGKNTGNLVHAIFEEIDFDDPANHLEIIRGNMEVYNIDKKWEGVVQELVHRTLHVPLQESFKLSGVKKKDKLVEMEFYVPIQKMSRRRLLTTLGKTEHLDDEHIDGFLKGFIDLIFRVGDTYYILDYKTNHLGSTLDDYSTSVLKDEMKSANFDIQYHLYTLALYRYLATRVPDFDYSKHFGGVFYLFVRGLNPDNPFTGVFFDKPEEALILSLDSLIQEGMHE